MDPESTDVKPTVDSSTTETAPLSLDAGLEKVVQDAFNKSTSSVEEKEEATTEEVVPGTTEPEVKPTEETPTDKESTDDLTKPEPKVEEKGPVPYERFAEVNKAKVAYESQVAEMQPKAQGYDSIANHCQENNIDPQKFQYWMDIAALAETNPQEALKRLEPTLSQLKGFVGEVLPKDLQAAVDAGEITKEWAQKLAATQAQQTFNSQRGQQLQQQAVARQQQEFQRTLVTGLDSWARSKAATNPDFIPKVDSNAPDGLYEFFIHKLNVMARTEKINSVEDLVVTAEKALKLVESSIGRYRSPVKPIVNVRAKTTASIKPTPIKNIDDAIAAAAAKHGITMASTT